MLFSLDECCQPPPFCTRYLRTINDSSKIVCVGVSSGGGCRSLGWTRWNIAPCSFTSPMSQSKSEYPFKEMMTDGRWQNTVKVELFNFEANIERERKKDFEHDIAALFLQLTQVLIMSQIVAKGRITSLSVWLIYSQPISGSIVPTECNSYIDLDEPGRYWSNNSGSVICDYHDPKFVNNKWYRFVGGAGRMMASYCIPKSSCSTHRSSWINGDHPTSLYTTVTTTVCMHWGSDCCEVSYPVGITQCDGYYVYKLQKPTGCSERYCGVLGEYSKKILL